jgi:hypothetical protein
VSPGRTRRPQWKIKAKKKGYEAHLDAHNNVQLGIVSKSTEALLIEVHCVRTTRDEDKKPGRNETQDKDGHWAEDCMG